MTGVRMGFAALVAAAFGIGAAAADTAAPYAGLDSRAIAALSDTDIAALLAGEGWGLALPAELNGYPGPAHVLQLADELSLTPDQRAAIQSIFDDMSSAAQALGADYVAAEAALDTAFAERRIDPAMLDDLTQRAAELRADLRATHLAAHLEVAPLLTHHQIMTYSTLRGYGTGPAGHGAHGSH